MLRIPPADQNGIISESVARFAPFQPPRFDSHALVCLTLSQLPLIFSFFSRALSLKRVATSGGRTACTALSTPACLSARGCHKVGVATAEAGQSTSASGLATSAAGKSTSAADWLVVVVSVKLNVSHILTCFSNSNLTRWCFLWHMNWSGSIRKTVKR